MRLLRTIFLIIILPIRVIGQLDYFISIDADEAQPFSVLLNKKVYSSSQNGHLIIPQLKDSTYLLVINFPKNEFPEQSFQISIGRRDNGFELKKAGLKSWVLYDWQRMELIPLAFSKDSLKKSSDVVKRSDPLANLMAGTVNDSSILISSKTGSSVIPIVDSNSLIPIVTFNKKTIQNSKDSLSEKPLSVSLNEPKPIAWNQSQVQLLVDKRISGGRQFVYAIMNGELMEEAVVIFIETQPEKKPVIPSDSTLTIPIIEANTVENKQSIIDNIEHPSKQHLDSNAILTKKAEIIKLDTARKDTLIKVEMPNDSFGRYNFANIIAKDEILKQDSINSNLILPIVTKTKLDSMSLSPKKKDSLPELVIINSDCQSFASDQDVDKLRVKLIDASSRELKMAIANKAYKSKCFTALQTRNLSETFTSEEEKMDFLEMAYPFVSDTSNFKQLVDLFSEESIKAKFKKMVRI